MEGEIRKLISIWLCMMLCMSSLAGITIFDTHMGIVGRVSGTTLYVNTTGSGGAYTSIQDAINAASHGDTIIVYSGTYEEELWIHRSINLTGENPDTTIVNGSVPDPVVEIVTDNVKISGFTFTSDRAFKGLFVETHNNIIMDNNFRITENGYGIHLSDSNQNNITRNNFSSPNQWGIYLNSSSNNRITDNIISNSYAGIKLEGSSNNLISGNKITLNRYRSIDLLNSEENDIIGNIALKNDYGMQLEASINCNILYNNLTKNHRGLSLRGSNSTNIQYNSFSSNNGIGLRLVASFYCNISSNNISENNYYGISLHSSYYNMISSNNLFSNYWSSIDLYTSSNNTISDNYVSSSIWGIHLESSENNTFLNNNITNCSHPLMIFEQSNYNVFTRNVFFDNPDMSINDSHNFVFSNNTFINSGGPELKYSNNSCIFNNTIHGSGIAISDSNNSIIFNNSLFTSGINIYYSYNSIIFNNTLITGKGIYLSSSNDSFIFNNSITSNSHGIRLSSSFNNTLYHNNFIDNGNQAEDDSINGNRWDNGYPSGGNYWSDYFGVDIFKGPDQNILGMDSIGDTDYSIDSDSWDKYPLLEMILDTLPPRIELIKPYNNSVINVDTVLEFDIYDGNLDYVKYSINDGENHSFSAPFNIFTANWVDGNYSIRIIASDSFGNINSSWYLFSVDATFPEVISVTPSDNSYDVPIDTTIILIFSEPIDITDFEDHISFVPYVWFKTHWNENRTKLSITFGEIKPKGDTEYHLIIKSNVTDVNGNRMKSDFEMVFTTEATPFDLNNVTWIWILLFIIIILIIILTLFLIKKKGKKSKVALSDSSNETKSPPSS